MYVSIADNVYPYTSHQQTLCTTVLTKVGGGVVSRFHASSHVFAHELLAIGTCEWLSLFRSSHFCYWSNSTCCARVDVGYNIRQERKLARDDTDSRNVEQSRVSWKLAGAVSS